MLRLLQSLCLVLAFGLACAADKDAASPYGQVVKGEVLETMDAGGFTYMKLKTKDGEVWTAVRETSMKPGTQVTVQNGMTMKDFQSKTLKRTFPLIVLGDLAGAPAAARGTGNPHASAAAVPDTPDMKVDKAKGANARTIAEVIAKSTELKDKPVLVRAKVVKFNGGIMGKNWIHLRDGSGSANDGSNDLLATTLDQANVGDVVNIEGVVRTDKNFGSGYAYKVMVEDAKVKK